MKSPLIKLSLMTYCLVFSASSFATIVQFQTVLGEFEVNLYDEDTPQTVANFLSYVNNDAYTNTIFHRSVNNFIVQGGGFIYNNEQPLSAIASDNPVVNEPEFSNVRGTIAMAKLGGNPNSATNQWFINVADNSANLDVQNGGFTVFGEVVGDGMDIVDAIADLPRYNLGGALASTPLRDVTQNDIDNNATPDDSNFVIVNAIVVLNAAEDTASDLTPTRNTLIDNGDSGGSNGDSSGNNGDSDDNGSDSGGGSISPLFVIFMCLFSLVSLNSRRKK